MTPDAFRALGSKAQVRAIFEMSKDMSIREIANIMGVEFTKARTVIFAVCCENGTQYVPKFGRAYRFDRSEAARMRANGMSYAKIGEVLGVSAAAVCMALRGRIEMTPEQFQALSSKDQIQTMLDMRRNHTFYDISKIAGMNIVKTRAVIHKAAEEMDIVFPNHRMRKTKVDKEKANIMRRNGYTYREIAEKLNSNTSSVYYALKRGKTHESNTART